MLIMKAKDKNSGHENTYFGSKKYLNKIANLNVHYFDVTLVRNATFNEMQAEVENLEAKIKLEEISLFDAPMHGGYSNRMNITSMKTRIINLNAAIAGIAEDMLTEALA